LFGSPFFSLDNPKVVILSCPIENGKDELPVNIVFPRGNRKS
jgi:chaperonin GroEL (HSP60 family)